MLYTTEEFFADLPHVSWSINPADRRVLPRDSAGVTIPIQRGPRLWQGSVTVSKLNIAAADVLRAKMDRLTESDGAFLLYPPHLCANGDIGTIGFVSSTDRRVMRIENNAFMPQIGDHLGIEQNGVYSLHRVNDVRVTTTTDIYVTPALPRQISVGANVTTDRPKVAMVMNRDTRPPAQVGALSDRFSFSCTQTLRAFT